MIELKLNADIYDVQKVKIAADAYKELCKIKLRTADDYIICNFTDCLYDPEETIKEFENYTIDLMNTGMKSYDSY